MIRYEKRQISMYLESSLISVRRVWNFAENCFTAKAEIKDHKEVSPFSGLTSFQNL